MFYSYLGKPPFNVFKEREDADQVYVTLKNRLKNHMLTDFYLEDAIKLLKRFIDALPDTLLCTRNYVEKVRAGMVARKDDFTYTRHLALVDLSKCLSPQHQMDFDCELKLNLAQASLKEPFSRDLRYKMSLKQKHLTGNAKHLKIGSLKKAEFELLGHWAAGTIPTPAPTLQERPPPKKPEKTVAPKGEKSKEKKKRKKDKKVDKNEPVEKKGKKEKGNSQPPSNGYKKITDGKVRELDEVRNAIAQVITLPKPCFNFRLNL